jgi:hypothetical protein
VSQPTEAHQIVLECLRARGKPVTVVDDLSFLRWPGTDGPLGYGVAFAAAEYLARLGLAHRLPGNPVSYEAMRDDSR